MCDLNHMIYYTLLYVDYISQIVFKVRKGYLGTPTIRLIINKEFNATLPFYATMTAETMCLFLFVYKVKCGCWKHGTIVIKLKTILKCVALIFV